MVGIYFGLVCNSLGGMIVFADGMADNLTMLTDFYELTMANGFFENGKGVDGVVKIESAEAGWEYGIAFTVPLDSPYASKLKKCTKVYGINCMVYCCDEKGCPVEHADSAKGDINYGLVSYVEETNELLGKNRKKSMAKKF